MVALLVCVSVAGSDWLVRPPGVLSSLWPDAPRVSKTGPLCSHSRRLL